MPTTKQKLLIFDVDGVLFDSIALVEEYLFRRFPMMTLTEAKEILTGNMHVELEKYGAINKPIDETPEQMEARQAEYAERKARVPMCRGMRDLLFELHGEGYVLTVNTSAKDRNCLPLFDNAQIRDLFGFIATLEVAKSKVDKFRVIEEKYGAALDDMLFVTDTLGDIREAKAAGVPTVAVTWGGHDRSYFEREPHENLIATVDSVDGLATAIRNYFSR